MYDLRIGSVKLEKKKQGLDDKIIKLYRGISRENSVLKKANLNSITSDHFWLISYTTHSSITVSYFIFVYHRDFFFQLSVVVIGFFHR